MSILLDAKIEFKNKLDDLREEVEILKKRNKKIKKCKHIWKKKIDVYPADTAVGDTEDSIEIYYECIKCGVEQENWQDRDIDTHLKKDRRDIKELNIILKFLRRTGKNRKQKDKINEKKP